MHLLDLQPNTLDVESAVAADLGPVYPDGEDYERSHIPQGRPEERVREGELDCRKFGWMSSIQGDLSG